MEFFHFFHLFFFSFGEYLSGSLSSCFSFLSGNMKRQVRNRVKRNRFFIYYFSLAPTVKSPKKKKDRFL